MATIIDHTYFVLNINLPQATTSEGIGTIQGFINKYEPDFLNKALGYNLAKAYLVGIAEMTPDQKWKDIRDGAEYTNGTNSNKWMGLQNSTTKLSPIANYVYCKFMDDKATDNTLVGVSKPKQSNATREDGETKNVKAWNEMVGWLHNLREFLYYNRETYPEWENKRSEVFSTKNVWGL